MVEDKRGGPRPGAGLRSATSAMHTEWITHVARLEEVAAAWERLAEHDRTPFSRHAWLSAWWEAYGAPGALDVCAVWDGEDLVAALPLHRRGPWLHAMANEHTPAYRPLARDLTALDHLAEAIAQKRSPILARGIPAEEPTSASMFKAIEDRGFRTILEPHETSPVTEIAGTFEEYRANLKGGWKELERRGRKMAREHDVRLTLIDRPDDLEGGLAEGLALEAAGWKGQDGTAILCDERATAFYRALAARFHAVGELSISTLRVDGRLAAFDLALLHERRYFLLKTAFDEGLRTLAPGLVLRRAVVEHSFEMELEAHEFLGPDSAWKRLFATGERRHAAWRSYPGGPLPSLRYAYRRHARPRLKATYLRAREAKSPSQGVAAGA